MIKIKNYLIVWLQTIVPAGFLAVACHSVHATELIYQPINPTFGGHPNNAQGLLNIANSQNSFKAPVIAPPVPPTALEKFNSYLSNLILTRLGSETINTLFGTGSTLVPGSYDAGGYQVKITPNATDGTLTIVTRDKATGASSSFVISSGGQL